MINSLTASDVFFIIVTLLISMTVHEFMHAYVGYKLGDPTASEEGRLSLNPLRHIDPLMTVVLPIVTLVLFHVPFLAAKPVPFNPGRVKYGEYGAAMIAAAGPLSNLVLAIIGTFILKDLSSSSWLVNALQWFVELNIFMFIFNLIPIPPLDGSRVLYAFAPEPLQDFMRSIERFGFVIIMFLVLIGGLDGVLDRLYNSVLSLISRV